MALMFSFLSAINLQTATKDELMCIKGIGDKKADILINYRKSNKLTSADDLLAIKGFGKGLVKNVEKNVKSVACGGKKSTKSSKSKSSKKSEKSKKKSENKKSEKNNSSKKDKSNKKLEKKSDNEKKKSKKKVSDDE